MVMVFRAKASGNMLKRAGIGFMLLCLAVIVVVLSGEWIRNPGWFRDVVRGIIQMQGG